MEANANLNSEARHAHDNPLFLIASGIPVKPSLPEHRQAARVGNLWYEYARDARSLRGIVRSGEQIAEFLDALGFILWHRDVGTYEWKGEPLTRAAFLKMVANMQEKTRHA